MSGLNLFNLKQTTGKAQQQAVQGSSGVTIFEEKPNDHKAGEDKILDSVVNTADSQGSKKSILGLKQEERIDTSDFIDEDYHLKKKLSFVKGLFFFLVFSSVTLLGYFFIQLSSTFSLLNPYLGTDLGTNITQTLTELDKNVISKQTAINEFRYLVAKTYLDEFSYYADQFLQDFDTYSNSNFDIVTRNNAENNLISYQEKLANSFEKTKEKLLTENWVKYKGEEASDDEYKVEFIGFLRDHLNNRKEVETKTNLKAANSDELIKEIDQTLKLVGNGELLAALKENDFSDISYDKVKDVIGQVNSHTENALSYIYQIKKKRIQWSKIISEIDLVTQKTDLTYNSGNFEQVGGIQYNNYQFDTNAGRVIVTGQTRSDTGNNFTIMANLIDQFEKSPLFKEVSMRSFSKSGDSDDGYVSNVKLDFSIQKESFEDADARSIVDSVVSTLSIAKEKITVKKPGEQAQTAKVKRK